MEDRYSRLGYTQVWIYLKSEWYMIHKNLISTKQNTLSILPPSYQGPASYLSALLCSALPHISFLLARLGKALLFLGHSSPNLSSLGNLASCSLSLSLSLFSPYLEIIGNARLTLVVHPRVDNIPTGSAGHVFWTADV